MNRQTIEHDDTDSSVPAVIRPLADILDSYRNRSRSDLEILLSAVNADSKLLTSRCRSGKFDEAQGIAKRMTKVSRKIEEIAEAISQGEI